MPVVRRSRADIDRTRRLRDLASRPQPSEAEIEQQAAQDDNAWIAADASDAVPAYPPATPAQVRALRSRLGLSQAQFARRFGFTVDTIQQYEQGRRVPSGPASTLLRVIAADPDAVVRALDPRRKPAARDAHAAE
ncbi:MAG TPA: helix-turn-helix domain-containing protein [Acetobacteraceae bacterium]|nr:helix-turn-helix domain-containing protein [Acetobacteraceae bacterium]